MQVAEAAGLPCVLSSALETSIGLATQLALAGALPELHFACGLDTMSLLQGDVVTNTDSLRPVDGYLPVPRTQPRRHPAGHLLGFQPVGSSREERGLLALSRTSI